MTTTYTPTGQVPPAAEYTLPQDVIDLVVVETVNNPFVTAADNAAWLLSAVSNVVSVKNFGAVGDGVADDLPAILAAIAYLAALGPGGLLLFPPPAVTYRITDAIVFTTDIQLLGLCGARVDLDSAAADFISISNGSGSGSGTSIAGLFFRCAQVTSGKGISVFGSGNKILFSDCILDFSKVSGEVLLDDSGNSQVTLRDCRTFSGKTSAGESMVTDSGSIIARGGSLTMAPGATADLISCVDGDNGTIELTGVNLTRLSTSASEVAFVSAHGTVTVVISGCDVDTDQASGITALVRIGTGCRLSGSGNELIGKTGVACPPFINSGLAAEGSQLALNPVGYVDESTAPSFTLPDGFDSVLVSCDATSVDITFPGAACPGQPFDAVYFNNSGSTVTPTIANSPLVMGDTVPPVDSGKTLTGRFVYHSLNPGFSPYRWIQIGTWGVGSFL